MIRILHLSDLHFHATVPKKLRHAYAQNKVSPSPTAIAPFPSLTLVDAVLAPLAGRHIDGLIITGDITYAAQPEEFDAARRAVEKLLKRLHLQEEQLLIVPGNHDADWNLPAKHRFKNYIEFYHRVRRRSRREFLSDELVLTGSNGERIRFVGVNSCPIESKEHAGIGIVGDQVLDRILRASRNTPDTTVLCLHHHLLPVSYQEREYQDQKRTSVVLDARAILEICQRANVSLVLHGHQHQPHLTAYGSLAVAGDNASRTLLWVAGAGSAGSVTSDLGSIKRRHFQVIEFNPSAGGIACKLDSFLSDVTDDRAFVAASSVAIDLSPPLPTGAMLHGRIESHVLDNLNSGAKSYEPDESDLFILLMRSKHCTSVNKRIRALRSAHLVVEGVYDLYGPFDLLVKVRTDSDRRIDDLVLNPLLTSKLIPEEWGRLLNIAREQHLYQGLPSPDENTHSIKAFVYFYGLGGTAGSVLRSCSDIPLKIGKRAVMNAAFTEKGGDALIVEYYVACGAFYDLGKIISAIERDLGRNPGQKVTLIAQTALEPDNSNTT